MVFIIDYRTSSVNTLVVNVAIVTRDLVFFVASLFLLMFAAANGEITLGELLAFLIPDAVHAVICSQTNNIHRAWNHFHRKHSYGASKEGKQAAARETEAPLLGNEVGLGEVGDKNKDEASSSEDQEERELRGVRGRSEDVARRLQSLAFREQQLSREMESGAAVGSMSGAARLHGALVKKCVFDDKLSVTSRKWQRRWFVLDENFWYCRDPLDPAASRRVVPLWTATAIKLDPNDRSIFTVVTPAQPYTFRACPCDESTDEGNNSAPTAEEWVEALNERLQFLHAAVDHEAAEGGVEAVLPPALPEGATVDSPAEDDEDASLLERPPASAPELTRAMRYITLPFAALFTCTVPNVKRARWRRWFVLTFVLVCAWLGALVHAMVYCADGLAIVLHIRADLMGLACTGIFASLPTLFGSLVCACQGAADMALANAIGSNTTCILLGFGVPFLVQTVCHARDPHAHQRRVHPAHCRRPSRRCLRVCRSHCRLLCSPQAPCRHRLCRHLRRSPHRHHHSQCLWRFHHILFFSFQSPLVGLVSSGMEAQHHWSAKEQSSLCCVPVCGSVDALCFRFLPFEFKVTGKTITFDEDT